jgi:hypothetical protein
VDVIAILRALLSRSLLGFIVILSLLATPAFPVEYQDSQIFISGFNAYQSKNYQGAIDKMSQVLEKYPDSPLRDMAIFWLARAHFKAGHRKEAAKYMAQFYHEYPDSPLKGTVEPELAKLAAAYAKGEPIQPAAPVAEEKAAAEKAATEKAATEKAATEKAATEKAAAEKAAAEKAAAEKAAAEKAAAEKAAAEKAAAEQAATEKAAAEKAATEKAAAEKAATEKAAAEKAAAEQAATEKAAAEQAATEKAAAEKAAAEQAATEKAAAERAAEKAAAEQAAAEQAAAEKAATEKAATEKAATEKAAAEKATAEKAEFGRLLAEKAATEKAWEARVAAEKAAAEKTAASKAAAEELAAKKAAARQAKAEKLAAKKAAARQARAAKAAARKAAAEKLAAERAAARKAKAEEAAAEKAARVKERQLAAAVRKAESSATMQEKAIAGYRAVIDSYPGSQAAITAAAKLKKLGIVYPLPAAAAVTSALSTEKTQVINLEVAQFADFAFTVSPAGQSYLVGKRFSIPFEVLNRGNGTDSFSLESAFPAEFDVRFTAEAAPESYITATPRLAPGEIFKGVMTAVIPRSSIDGQKYIFPIKAASQFARDFSQSREVLLVASAPLLRAVIKPDRAAVSPGEKVTYRIVLLNVGSADASNLVLRLNYPQLYEPVDSQSSGFHQEMKGAIAVDGLKINSGESREFSVVLQVKEEATARQGLFLRGDVINNELETKESFLSTVTVVQGISGVAAKIAKENLSVIPGQIVTIPIVVTNTGNVREAFQIKPEVPAGISCHFFQDLKRDGIRQTNAPSITSTGTLEPRENAYLLMELATQPSAPDSSSEVISAAFTPEDENTKNATVTVSLRFTRPIVDLSMMGEGSKLKPGEVSSFELNVVNRGSNLAKSVEIQSFLPDNLEMMAADVPARMGSNGEYIWKFAELGAAEKRSVRVTFRVRSGIAVGTNIQIRNLVTYEDQLGNRY